MGFPLKPLTGLWGFPPFSNATQCAPGECNAEPDWQMPLDEAISKVGQLWCRVTLLLFWAGAASGSHARMLLPKGICQAGKQHPNVE